jgi:hypothetical protein
MTRGLRQCVVRNPPAIVWTTNDAQVMESMSFEIHPLPIAILNQIRDTGRDVSGNPVERVVANGGEPLRCCLRDARAGEECILFGYEPSIPVSPYREIGAVFAHGVVCAGPQSTVSYPAGWLGRPQVLRAYDTRGWIHPATTVHDGSRPETVIGELLSHPDVVQIHSRNVAYGCYMFRITRTPEDDQARALTAR